MTPREIIAGRLAKLVDRARELPRAAVKGVVRE
jgi:hypothetical protein